MAKGKELVRFNIQNLAYAVPSAEGKIEGQTFVSYGTSTKLALEMDAAEKIIYGDGKSLVVLPNERGKTGTVTTNNVSVEYEIAMGRKIKTSEGRIADIKQMKAVVHALYFEVCGIDDKGAFPVAKTILYNVTSSRPNESFDQNTEDINESTFDTAFKVAGTPLLAADGRVYRDENGNEVIVWQMTVTPDDPEYEDFGKTVVLPKMSA